MTAEACINFCAGSNYAAVKYASECYCGSGMITAFQFIHVRANADLLYVDLNSGSVPAPSADCGMTCSGDRWEVCGGSRRINRILPFSRIGPS
jgi:hypothetical protein